MKEVRWEGLVRVGAEAIECEGDGGNRFDERRSRELRDEIREKWKW